MTSNNTTRNHLPINHREPTTEELHAQREREEKASALGRIKAEQALRKQKEGMDYSRSEGGGYLLDQCLYLCSEAITTAMDSTLKRAGLASATLGPLYQKLTDKLIPSLPKLDEEGKDTGELSRQTTRSVNLWDSDEIAFIVLLTMIDTCRMPLLGNMTELSGSGKRFGTRPTNYKLESIISDRINDHLCHRYIRECTKNTGQDKLLDFILKDAYSHKAGWSQKKTNTRLMRKDRAQEFRDNDLSPFAKVLQWKPFTNREGHALAGKLISYVVKGCELWLGFKVFETVDKWNEQYYGLTPKAEQRLDQLDLKRLGKTFVPDVMVCPPRPHTKDQAGGYVGMAQSLIKRSFTGGFKGSFEPSLQHQRFINGQQNIPFKINKEILEVMNALEAQPWQEWREQGNFIPAPHSEQYLISPEVGPPTKGMTKEQKEERKKEVKVVAAEWRVYKAKQSESEASLTTDTLALANRVADLERFWMPVQGGFRGRAYCANHLLNSQGMGYQKSLLLFANEVPVDEFTQRDLQWAIAGFGGQDKKSWEYRTQWFIQHKEQILDSIKDMDSITDPKSFWRTFPEMDDEWAFLACALEYRRLFESDDMPLTTGIIVAVDATCSGGQLIAGFTGSRKTAQATNLLPGPEPFDIYKSVLRVMQERIKELGYKNIPLLDQNGNELKGGDKKTRYMEERRVRYLFSTDPAKMAAVRKGIKGGFLPRLYGAGMGKTIAGMREKFKFIHISGKTKKLSIDEARALAPFFEEGLNHAVPALTAYVNWARNVADLALRVEVEKAEGDTSKRVEYEPRQIDGEDVLEIRTPMPNDSVMIQRYPVTKAKALRIDHLTTHSLYDPSAAFRDQQLHEATDEVDFKAMSKACAPNFIHAADAAVLADLVDGYEGNYSLVHDCIGCSPGRQRQELIERFQKSFERVTSFDYLNGILDENKITRRLNQPPTFGTFKPEMSKGSDYMVC